MRSFDKMRAALEPLAMIRAGWVQRCQRKCSFRKVMQLENQMGLTLPGPPHPMGIEVCMPYYSPLHPAPCDPVESQTLCVWGVI